jgi:hypothetical protein
MNCQNAVATCPNTANLSLTFGYLNPVGIVGGVSQAKGVIVYLTGDDGTSPGNVDYLDAYFKAGFEVVSVAWGDAWEQAYYPIPSGTYGNIQNAACRPATFLNYVYTAILPNLNNSSAAMCAQGQSAGSAAVAYSLAYYGAGAWLDSVELLSGPVFSDIKQGCEVTNTPPIPVTVCGGGQYGCQLGSGGSSWTLSPEYLSGANTSVGTWTNDANCANTTGTITSSTENSAWLAQSIVDQSTGAVPTFTYSSTAMSAWLCRSVKNAQLVNCSAIGNADFNSCPNNSSPQGEIFYANFSSTNHPPSYNVYAVDYCLEAEGVVGGNVPGYQPAIFHGTIQGFNAIIDDMIGNSAGIAAQCTARH